MDFDREVEWICEQPLELHYVKDGRTARHVPDLLVWRAEYPELCDVKSAERVEDLHSRRRSRRPGWRALRPGSATGCCRSPIGSLRMVATRGR